jgi:hypothetical protein
MGEVEVRVACQPSRHAARAGITAPPGRLCGMHSLRGALAVAMIGNGASIPVVSAVLGHASSDTTQAYYLRFDVDRLRCCALDVEDVIDTAGAVSEMTLPDLVADLVALRHTGGYRFKILERGSAPIRRPLPVGGLPGRVDHQRSGRRVPLRPSPAVQHRPARPVGTRPTGQARPRCRLGYLHPGPDNSRPCPSPAAVCAHRRGGAPLVRRRRLSAHVLLLEQGDGRPGPVQSALRRRAEGLRGAQSDPAGRGQACGDAADPRFDER